MNNPFQPLGCSLGRPVLPPAPPAESTPEETVTMDKRTESIADTILRVIAEAGGQISGTKLAAAMPDIADANRRYHAGQLRKAGRITTSGKTSHTIYHLADSKKKAAPAKGLQKTKGKKKSRPKETATQSRELDQFGRAEQMAAERAAEAARNGAMPAAQTGTLEDQNTTAIAPHLLRRVLLLALRAPGDIVDADRQALHAIAAAS